MNLSLSNFDRGNEPSGRLDYFEQMAQEKLGRKPSTQEIKDVTREYLYGIIDAEIAKGRGTK